MDSIYDILGVDDPLTKEDIDLLTESVLGNDSFREIKTVEQALEAVKNFGDALKYVPEELRTAEVCLEAIRHSEWVKGEILTTGNALEFVPETLKTAELCAEAVKNNCKAIEFMPKSLITAKLCTDVVKYYCMVLQYIPEEFKTQELCIEAVKQKSGYLALEYVPEKFKTTKLYIEIVKNSYWLIAQKYIPEQFRTAKFWLEVVKKDSDLITEVPEEFKTAEFWYEAVKNNVWSLTDVPEEFKTLDMYIEAVKQEDWMFMLVPENLKVQVTRATGVQQGGAENFLLYKHNFIYLQKGKNENELEKICIKLTEFCEIARREGVIALENYIDKEKLSEKALLETGIQMAIDGVEREIIEKYFNSWLTTNFNTYYEKILASVIKSGVLSIQAGENPKVAEYKMTILIPEDLIPDSLLPSKETYFRRKNG